MHWLPPAGHQGIVLGRCEVMDPAALGQVAGRRSQSYWLLSRLVSEAPHRSFLEEISATLAGAPLNLDAPLGVETAMLLESLAGVDFSEDGLNTLRVEHTRLLGALGESYGAPAPYESVSRPGTAAGESCAAVVRCYADAGFDPPLPGDGPADSLASELRFLALACYRESRAWSAEDRPEAFAWAEVERQFLDDHVLQWVPRHCEALCLRAETPYFRAVARLIARACIVDREDVAELCAWATLSTDSAA